MSAPEDHFDREDMPHHLVGSDRAGEAPDGYCPRCDAAAPYHGGLELHGCGEPLVAIKGGAFAPGWLRADVARAVERAAYWRGESASPAPDRAVSEELRALRRAVFKVQCGAEKTDKSPREFFSERERQAWWNAVAEQVGAVTTALATTPAKVDEVGLREGLALECEACGLKSTAAMVRANGDYNGLPISVALAFAARASQSPAAEDEREACAKICESHVAYYEGDNPVRLTPSTSGDTIGHLFAQAIRARSPEGRAQPNRNPAAGVSEEMVEAAANGFGDAANEIAAREGQSPVLWTEMSAEGREDLRTCLRSALLAAQKATGR